MMYRWYIGTGPGFTTPEISATNYYVGANNGVTAATIGATYSGSGTNSTNVGSHGIVITHHQPQHYTYFSPKIFTGKKELLLIQIANDWRVVASSATTPEITGWRSIPVTVPEYCRIHTRRPTGCLSPLRVLIG